MKRLLIILVACASHALAGPIVRVSIDAKGEPSGLILQAYTACLRNTPGVVVVPLGQPADAHIEITSIILMDRGFTKTGYVWASVVYDPATYVLLEGPNQYIAGSNQDIRQQAASDVQVLDRDVFISLRNQPNN